MMNSDTARCGRKSTRESIAQEVKVEKANKRFRRSNSNQSILKTSTRNFVPPDCGLSDFACTPARLGNQDIAIVKLVDLSLARPKVHLFHIMKADP